MSEETATIQGQIEGVVGPNEFMGIYLHFAQGLNKEFGRPLYIPREKILYLSMTGITDSIQILQHDRHIRKGKYAKTVILEVIGGPEYSVLVKQKDIDGITLLYQDGYKEHFSVPFYSWENFENKYQKVNLLGDPFYEKLIQITINEDKDIFKGD